MRGWACFATEREAGLSENPAIGTFIISTRGGRTVKLLFICTGNLERSPTAEKLFKDRFETRSAGVVCGSAATFSAISPRFKKLDKLFCLKSPLGKQVTAEMLEWADAVIVMEKWHQEYLTNKFQKICENKRIFCLDIPDRYYRDDPRLIRLLETKVKEMLEEAPETPGKDATPALPVRKKKPVLLHIPQRHGLHETISASSTRKKKVLFICAQNLMRSPTAEELFRDKFETRSAGLHNNWPVTRGQFKWADVIVVMEEEHRIELMKRFPRVCKKKRLVSLDIPDNYSRDDPKLIRLLKRRMKKCGLLAD